MPARFALARTGEPGRGRSFRRAARDGRSHENTPDCRSRCSRGRSHFAIYFLKRARQAHGIAVQVARPNVMFISLLPDAFALQELGDAIMRFGKFGLESRAACDIVRGCASEWEVSSRRAARNSRPNASRSRRLVPGGRNDRLGSKPVSLAGGAIRIGSAFSARHKRRSPPAGGGSRFEGPDIQPLCKPAHRPSYRLVADAGGIAIRHLSAVSSISAVNGETRRIRSPSPDQAWHPSVEIIVDLAQIKPGRELVVATIDDHDLGTAFDPGELLVLVFECLTRCGQRRDVGGPAREPSIELPGSRASADRDPKVIRHALGA